MGRSGVFASDFTLRKCAKSEQILEDHISQLPLEIILNILSFLTSKEAARTCVLSKRWTNLWKYSPSLEIDDSVAFEKIGVLGRTVEGKILRARERCKYVKWVNRLLQLHKASALDEFRVKFDLDDSSQEAIDNWLQFAFGRKVQRLELNLSAHPTFWSRHSQSYTFAHQSLSWRTEKGMNRLELIDFKSLKSLILKRVNVCSEVLEFFLRKCQFLEHLVLHEVNNLINLEVSGPSAAFKRLEICLCYNMKCLTVCNSNLVSLKTTEAEQLVLKNVPLLVDVYVCCWSFNLVRDVIPRLSCCLSQLEVLRLPFLSEEAGRLEEMVPELPELPKLKQLTLDVSAPMDDRSLLGLTSFIRGAPHLEKLVIKLEGCSKTVGRCRNLEKATNYPLQHLKVFELSGYCCRTSDVELIKFFSENADTLKKIMINPLHFKPESPEQIKVQPISRRVVEEQLEGLISSHVALEIF